MMKYFDLNLSPTNDFSNLTDNEAMCSMISNEVFWVDPRNASNQLTLEYNKKNQILKIVHHNFSLKITDFSSYIYLPNKFFAPFQVAIGYLAARNYSLNIVSKYGTFKPVITQKMDVKEPFLNAYVLYDEEPIKQMTFFRLNNLQLDINNNPNDTTIILFPVSQENLDYIKSSFSFLGEWYTTVDSKCGRLLISEKKTRGKIFIGGKLNSSIKANLPLSLFYSYEIDKDEIEPSWINDCDNQTIYQLVKKVLDGLSTKDKKKIFLTLVDNYSALEWSSWEVQVLIARFLIKYYPDEYVLCGGYKEDQDYPMVAAMANKKLIYLSWDAHYKLRMKKQDIKTWAQDYLTNKYDGNYLNDELNGTKKENLKIVTEFCNYFASQYDKIHRLMEIINKTDLKVLVIKDYINDVGFFNDNLYAIVIDEDKLQNLADAYSSCYQILQQEFDFPYANQFGTVWIKLMKEFEDKRIASKANDKKHLN